MKHITDVADIKSVQIYDQRVVMWHTQNRIEWSNKIPYQEDMHWNLAHDRLGLGLFRFPSILYKVVDHKDIEIVK